MPTITDATAAELFARLVLERGSLAPPDVRAAEKAADVAARAELVRRADAVGAIAEQTARGRGAQDTLGRHRHVVACGLATELLLAIGGAEATAVLLSIVAAVASAPPIASSSSVARPQA